MSDPQQTHESVFTGLRPLLFTVAYELTGSAADADDVLQDSYLRWSAVDLDQVTDVRSYLAKIVSRQSLNTLRAASRRREEYVGPWLPEPVLMAADDPATDVALADSVSMAMLVVLETLSPDERAVFVLRDVFGFDHDAIAEIVGKSVTAVRQLAHRAREHVRVRRRRFEPAGEQAHAIAAQFLTAAATGDLQTLLTMLAPDAVLVSDGGGKVTAARKPVLGAERVARFIIGISRIGTREDSDYRLEAAVCNSAPAVIVHAKDRVELVVLFDIAEGAVSGVYLIRNPDKLASASVARPLAR